MKKFIFCVFSFIFFCLMYINPIPVKAQTQEVKKTEITTCYCGIDDYKCRTGSGSCNVGSQTICSVDCGGEQ